MVEGQRKDESHEDRDANSQEIARKRRTLERREEQRTGG